MKLIVVLAGRCIWFLDCFLSVVFLSHFHCCKFGDLGILNMNPKNTDCLRRQGTSGKLFPAYDHHVVSTVLVHHYL